MTEPTPARPFPDSPAWACGGDPWCAAPVHRARCEAAGARVGGIDWSTIDRRLPEHQTRFKFTSPSPPPLEAAREPDDGYVPGRGYGPGDWDVATAERQVRGVGS